MQQPNFNHPEVKVFYEHDLNIPREKVEAVLQLPRETLVEDLRKMLRDAIDRYEYFKKIDWSEDTHEFPMHALWLLADLKAEEALPDVLDLLRQDYEFLEFWFNDRLTESLWEVIYHIGDQSLDSLKSFVLESGNDTYGRSAVTTAVEQIALHQPERKEEIVEWYESIFEHFLALDKDNPILDEELISFMVVESISLKEEDLLPLIKKLYDRGLVLEGIPGSYHSVEQGMGKKKSHLYTHTVYSSIFERYEDAVSSWHYYRLKYDEDYGKSRSQRPQSPEEPAYAHSQVHDSLQSGTFKRQGKKVGRNDPCPCGSGKKYKKCCGKK